MWLCITLSKTTKFVDKADELIHKLWINHNIYKQNAHIVC